MDSFELNKILGAVLGTCLFLLSLNIAANALFAPHAPEKPGFAVAVKEETKGGAAAAAPADEPLPKRLASADMGRGGSGSRATLRHFLDHDLKARLLRVMRRKQRVGGDVERQQGQASAENRTQDFV